ncbi:MAG TPA: nitrilase-related carbon-nitrogen hydrolase [Ornithinibacter sp.]|nr:nitrilase-related carbon-nitrogen hydrolase [Ornithinibacter sp.]
MRIAVVQLGYDDDEPFGARVDRVAALVADQAGHDLVVLPELWGATGFDYTRWAGEAQPLDGPWARAMADAARAASATLHAGSFVERLPEPGADGNDLANTSLLLDAGGSPLAVYRKIHRFGFGAGEPRLMEAGVDVVVTEIPSGTGASVHVGLSTCYDLRFPELYRQQVEAGAELFVVPAAWPAARVGHWTLLGRARAIENQCVVVQCNTAGTHAGYEMGGHSQVVTASGEVLAEAAGSEQQVLSVEVDLEATTAYRRAFPVLDDRRL